LPKGVSVSIFVYQIHRDPEVFPNPEDFIPERFSTENSSGRDAFAFLPFSGGKRDCIGTARN
jgi:cytochrome P450